MTIRTQLQTAQAKFQALRVGIRCEDVQGGFHLFDIDNGQQLGFDNGPWSASDVMGYCKAFEAMSVTGVFKA